MSYTKFLNNILYNPSQNSCHTTFTIFQDDLPSFLTSIQSLNNLTHLYSLTIKQHHQYFKITISLNDNYKF